MELPELGLSFDEEGNARLVVDETLAVNVSRNDEEGRLTLAANDDNVLPHSCRLMI